MDGWIRERREEMSKKGREGEAKEAVNINQGKGRRGMKRRRGEYRECINSIDD